MVVTTTVWAGEPLLSPTKTNFGRISKSSIGTTTTDFWVSGSEWACGSLPTRKVRSPALYRSVSLMYQSSTLTTAGFSP